MALEIARHHLDTTMYESLVFHAHQLQAIAQVCFAKLDLLFMRSEVSAQFFKRRFLRRLSFPICLQTSFRCETSFYGHSGRIASGSDIRDDIRY